MTVPDALRYPDQKDKFSARILELGRRITRLEQWLIRSKPGTWVNVGGFLNGWNDYGLATSTTSWQRTQLRRVEDMRQLRGTLMAPASGAIGVVIWNLASTDRPPKDLAYAVTAVSDAADTIKTPELQVQADGDIILMHSTNGTHVHLGLLQWSVTA